jgi:hypothetical protein
MIQGLKVTISGTDVSGLAITRAEFHKARAATYQRQVDSMKSDRAEGTEDQEQAKYSNVDPLVQLKDKVTSHLAQESELRFIAKHIDMSERYLLDYQDLQKLGIISTARGW